MSQYFLNKYTALAIAVQVVVLVWVSIGEFLMLPHDDPRFVVLFFFYSPPMYLLSTLLNLRGESGMFATVIYGMPCGIVLYGALFGFVFSFLKKQTARAQIGGSRVYFWSGRLSE